MKANELMIGDWVLIGTKAVQVYPIMFTQMFRKNPEADTEDYDVHPIPLTPEILEKNGFVYNDLPFVQAWEKYGLSIYGDGLINCGQNVTLKCQYVHELQHVLRLCGIEKCIAL